jgi:hypothetical protein
LLDVKYAVLHYLYSGPALTQEWGSRLLGISLDLPSIGLDGSKPFTPPPARGTARLAEDGGPSSFLWQAPNSNAALFTAQKWIELHALVANMVSLQHTTPPLPAFFDKQVSKKHPAWLEHALRLSRARGYFTLYPSVRTLATVHSELYRAPEEYEGELARAEGAAARDAERPVPAPGGTLVDSLPGRGILLDFDEMPLLLWDGSATTLRGLDDAAAAYADDFRRAVGGCQALAPADLVAKKSTADLFCRMDE